MGLLVTLNFALPRAMPGDPITALYAEGSGQAISDAGVRDQLRSYYGLDQPLHSQFGSYLGALAHGDLGTSIRFGAPVTEVIGARLVATLALAVSALAVGTLVGVAAGLAAGQRPDSWIDRGAIVIAASVRSVPVFVSGAFVLMVFAVGLGWFPISGSRHAFASPGVVAAVGDRLHHLALPVMVMAAHVAATQFLLMRASVVAEVGNDYVITARSKGLSDATIARRHIAPNALLPVVNLTGVQVGGAVTAATLVEVVFNYDGIGLLLVRSVAARDYPVLQGCFLAISTMVIAANALADLVSRRLDPRGQ
jgi:peptide/nickel transport system permease protein